MLHKELVVKGPAGVYSTPGDGSLGKYLLDCIKKRDPDDIFCIDGETGETLTCGQLVNDILKLAYILRSLGVQKGDPVAIVSENSIKYCSPFFALFYIGAAANLLNPIYTKNELKNALSTTKAKIVFCSYAAFKNVNALKTESDCIKKIILMNVDVNSDSIDTHGVDNLDSLLENASIDVGTVEPTQVDGKKDTCLILLSSGTTGLPKCVMITPENMRTPALYFNDPNYLKMARENAIAIMPFFHVFGGGCSIYAAALHSTKITILSSFKPDVFLRCIQEYKITFLCAVPPMVAFLAKHPMVKRYDTSSLKCVLVGGAYLGEGLCDEFKQTYPNVSLIQTYGLTETTGAATICLDRRGSIGYLIPDTECMVWNKDLKENVGPLETGELCFRGQSLMKGYMGQVDNDIDEFGFYHTGDLGFYDKDGYLYIVGRIKELIKYKGFQVSPVELEDLLTKHPAVKECGVIGIPDDRAGQLPTALIVRQNDAAVTEKEVVDFVAERISVHKHLYGGVKFIDFIPRNATGKILRDKLQELY